MFLSLMYCRSKRFSSQNIYIFFNCTFSYLNVSAHIRARSMDFIYWLKNNLPCLFFQIDNFPYRYIPLFLKEHTIVVLFEKALIIFSVALKGGVLLTLLSCTLFYTSNPSDILYNFDITKTKIWMMESLHNKKPIRQ